MDTNTTLTILCIVEALILFAITIWLMLRRRYPGEITYYKESGIGLFDSIVRNIGDLKVLYKDEPVSENMVLLKGYIMNTGSKDITVDMVEEPLALKLPEGFKFLDAKVVPSKTQVKASLTIKDATIAEFDLGLFRVDELVKFEALAEVPTGQPESESSKQESAKERLKDSMQFVHRIADTRKVIASQLPSLLSLKGFIVAFGLFTLFGLGSIGFVGFSVLTKGGFGQKELHFLVETESGDTVETKIDVARDGMLVIKGVDSSLERRQSVTDFFAGSNWKPKVVKKSASLLSICLSSMLFVLFGVSCLFLAIGIWQQFKNTRKMRGILSRE
jgi:hypothetical protein